MIEVARDNQEIWFQMTIDTNIMQLTGLLSLAFLCPTSASSGNISNQRFIQNAEQLKNRIQVEYELANVTVQLKTGVFPYVMF